MYKVQWAAQSKKEYAVGFRFKWYAEKMVEILTVLHSAPFEPTPGHHFERLTGNLTGYCSRQINHKHRVLYKVFPNTVGLSDNHGKPYDGIVLIYRAWKHNYQKPGK